MGEVGEVAEDILAQWSLNGRTLNMLSEGEPEQLFGNNSFDKIVAPLPGEPRRRNVSLMAPWPFCGASAVSRLGDIQVRAFEKLAHDSVVGLFNLFSVLCSSEGICFRARAKHETLLA